MARESVYRLKVTLKSIAPAVWRRVEVRGSATLGELHEVIQGVMRWENAHLHEFVFGEAKNRWSAKARRYSDPGMGMEGAGDEWAVTLAEAAPAMKMQFSYVYDFGDDWAHEVVVERIGEAEEGVRYPRCTGGARLAPMEDSGGPWGWMDKVGLINDPAEGDEEQEEERRDIREWMGLKEGEKVDTEAFDVDAVNARLRRLLGEAGKEAMEEGDEEEEEEEGGEEGGEGVRWVSYEVVAEAMEEDSKWAGPEEVQGFLRSIYYQVQENPKKMIPELEKWLEKYPTAARLMNYLGAAYARAGREEDARAMAERAYRANPDYLFARLNYAEFFLRDQNYEKVKEVMEDKWDIGLLYPERRRFHISEVLGFIGVAGRYLVGIGNLEVAARYLEMAMELDPDSDVARVLTGVVKMAAMKEGMKQMMDSFASRRRVKKRQAKGKKRKGKKRRKR